MQQLVRQNRAVLGECLLSERQSCLGAIRTHIIAKKVHETGMPAKMNEERPESIWLRHEKVGRTGKGTNMAAWRVISHTDDPIDTRKSLDKIKKTLSAMIARKQRQNA